MIYAYFIHYFTSCSLKVGELGLCMFAGHSEGGGVALILSHIKILFIFRHSLAELVWIGERLLYVKYVFLLPDVTCKLLRMEYLYLLL